MNQIWFEMPEIRRRTFAKSVWIPLRAVNTIEEVGQYGFAGYKLEFFGAGSLAIPVDKKTEAEKLGWNDVGISHCHSGYIQDDEYIPSNVYKVYDGKLTGECLVLEQRGNSNEKNEWHLNQDFVITLGLKREGDVWVRPDEGYIKVAKLYRRKDSSPCLIKVRAIHLRDYLCARKMALYITSYRDRAEVVEDVAHLSWKEKHLTENKGMDRWEGGVFEIHEGGMPFGEKTAVFHASRTDIDPEEDVPTFGLPTKDNVKSESWIKEYHERKLYLVKGELWRNEWIEPASKSPLVRRDQIPPTIFFITDAEGNQENRETLVNGSRWLWFRPNVVTALTQYRGGSLSWYTRDTGSVGYSPDGNVHFGINSLGLVNVYAKDIGMLPEWQQKIWAGYNINPEGKVSKELLASQMKAEPVNTQAPEAFLSKGLVKLNRLAKAKYGITIIRFHEQIPKLIERSHRFRATDENGLFELAKDLARITADSFDDKVMQKLVAPPKGTKWGSLKSLENLLATTLDPSHARAMLSPLFGIYDLRLADAHLSKKDIEEPFKLLGVDRKLPAIIQGYQLLNSCVSCIYEICRIIGDEKNHNSQKEDSPSPSHNS
jgi:hypothetical protein